MKGKNAMHLTATSSQFLLGILVVLALVACGGAEPPKVAGPPAIPVKVASVSSETIDEASKYIASLESRRSVTLQPQIDGQVSRILVRAGDTVKTGTLLIQVDPARQSAAFRSSAAAIELSRADIQSARETLRSSQAEREARLSNVKFRQQEYDRYASLVKEGAVSQQVLDQNSNGLDSAKSSLAAIDAQIASQRALVLRSEQALEQATANSGEQQVELQYYKITAPFNGTVGDIPVKVGDYVSSSTRLISVTQNQPLEVNVSVPMERSAELRKGMTVQLLDAQGRAVGDSRVFFISPNVDNNNQSVLIKALYDNPQNRLRADQVVQAQVIWGSRSGVVVPTTAVSRVAGQNFVFVTQTEPKDKKLVARQRPIQLGEIQGNDYQVTSGLKAQEQIVVSGILNLTDGAPIVVQP
ncbi:MAG: efflux RND transporter periplasmic adaptor subunit [Gemmatimonadaceae bacterium]|nr:efflux RND transporter periplasmic adaptor subunit [Gloeobacterales cyanobacterium ES-bin-141]